MFLERQRFSRNRTQQILLQLIAIRRLTNAREIVYDADDLKHFGTHPANRSPIVVVGVADVGEVPDCLVMEDSIAKVTELVEPSRDGLPRSQTLRNMGKHRGKFG